MAKRTLNILTIFLLWLSLIFTGHKQLNAQKTDQINWLNFEQLEDSLKVNPKKVFVYFNADWCTYCHKMDRNVFEDPTIIERFNKDYYVVKMNIESEDTIIFGNTEFKNKNANKRMSVHEIPLMMASRKGKPFSLPAMVVLNENFEATARYFQYLDAQQMLEILEN
ncbi:thioredoxin family protein [Roseivirga sp.]|uniref:thioredoxin family protein n=1 Tax=Roseivirga sp. TaxID=1964215 RepID=UPI002B27A45B|nr:thioredoxin family protein [Roseivirga sp.]